MQYHPTYLAMRHSCAAITFEIPTDCQARFSNSEKSHSGLGSAESTLRGTGTTRDRPRESWDD
jgi:hypothetical protein